jgi:hypothetical protein
MTVPDKDVTETPQQLSLFWQNVFVWLAGFLLFLTLMKIFEYTPRPAEISLVELGFFAAVFTLGGRHFAAAKQTGQSKWAALVDMSAALVIVLGVLGATKLGVDWLAERFAGNWHIAARILNADIVWLGCFLLAIYHPGSKNTDEPPSDNDSATEAKP